MVLDGGNRHHPIMGILQVQPTFLRRDRAGLQQQHAGDDLQAIGDPVLHLLQQHPAFFQQLILLEQQRHVQIFNMTDLRHIIDHHQNASVLRIAGHDAPNADHQPVFGTVRVCEIGLIVSHFRATQKGILDQHVQLRDPPFARPKLS